VTLRDPAGRPIAGAELTLRTARGEQHARAGVDGGFVFTQAAVGDSAVGASLGGVPLRLRAHPRVRVAVGASVAVELVSERPSGVISGVLRDAEGQPLAGALVTARAEAFASTDSEAWGPDGALPQRTNTAGSFTIAGLPAATYTITAQRVGGGLARRERVAIGETLALAIAPGGRVSGTVARAGGGAPGSFAVELVDTRTGRRRGDTFIGTDGVWGFDGVDGGSLEVRVRAREGLGVQALTLAAGEQRDGLRIGLTGTATLRGSVLDLAGAPVAGLEVDVGTAEGRVMTDEAGRFELVNVAVGRSFVTVGPPGGPVSPYGASRVAVEVPADVPRIELPAIRVATRRLADGVARGDLGFTLLSPLEDDDPLLADLKVRTVRPSGPAAAAGLRPFDEIVAVDDQDVRGANRSLYTTMTEVPAGTIVRLGLARGETVAITAGRRR
jgi:hypothetical protein